MKNINARSRASAAPASAAPKVVAWREAITLVRMGLAFLSPYPFLTQGLKETIERREGRLAAQAARRQEAGRRRRH